MRLGEVYRSYHLTEPDFIERKNRLDMSYFAKPGFLYITSKGLLPASIVRSVTCLSQRQYLIDKSHV